jgi:hypothetical protein
MRRLLLVISLLGVALVGGVVAVDMVEGWAGGPKPMCRAMQETVQGIDSFRWDNGMTHSAASWSQVLTDGVIQADAEDRQRIADAVRADGPGYEAFLAALPVDVRPSAERLHGLALDPDAAERLGPTDAMRAEAMVLHRLGNQECGFA